VGKALPLADNEAAALKLVAAAKVVLKAEPVVAAPAAPVAPAIAPTTATPVPLKRARSRKKDAKPASGKPRRRASAA
jgi:hypothetical protein